MYTVSFSDNKTFNFTADQIKLIPYFTNICDKLEGAIFLNF